jgi:hypothetical protein
LDYKLKKESNSYILKINLNYIKTYSFSEILQIIDKISKDNDSSFSIKNIILFGEKLICFIKFGFFEIEDIIYLFSSLVNGVLFNILFKRKLTFLQIK